MGNDLGKFSGQNSEGISLDSKLILNYDLLGSNSISSSKTGVLKLFAELLILA